ncbi:hypothetical protein PFICI_05402 [Pestalotiopsis fici W106-1]|uniref:Aflatoxin regulatory protein domain-containing protein n=1 Tax=Pestalotiopsis fici (strain W106-1 / CGMCC3.15140) TaxID=1229662 RepID=W3XE97_PESFW|nr:uncharacterized protein PFICI_05402 [Pestalotiopsis fici W106-1]ETS83526.1 hypothetical protein PFICI_05402 [Pestalotiopsis fici W106-1]
MVADVADHGIAAPDAPVITVFSVQTISSDSAFSEQQTLESPPEEPSTSRSDSSSHVDQEFAQTQITESPCSCIHDAIRIVQQLDDDHFRITTLSLDQVLWLQKNILAQCDKPLQCDACSKLPSVYSVLIIICDRLTEMFECIHKRLKRVIVLIAHNTDSGSDSSASSTRENNGQSSKQLFCSNTGQMADEAPCSLELFQSGPQSGFSKKEQLYMMEGLLKFQIHTFKGFLAQVEALGSSVTNLARQSRHISLMTRLGMAANNIAEEVQRSSR